MADIKNARAAARQEAAAGSATEDATGKKARMPSPRTEEGNGSNDQNTNTGGEQGTTEQPTNTTPAPAPAPVAGNQVPLVVVAPNPKRANTESYAFYDKYPQIGTLSSVAVALANGVRSRDISWDQDHRHILVGDEATRFCALTTLEERAQFLVDLKDPRLDQKKLIKWGYLTQPAPAAPPKPVVQPTLIPHEQAVSPAEEVKQEAEATEEVAKEAKVTTKEEKAEA